MNHQIKTGALRGRRIPTEIDTRRDGPNIRLARAMGCKEGYVPMPPPQARWQMAAGEPPLHRVWSWMVQHTIERDRMSPFAVREDGTPATLRNCAADLGLDLSQVSNVWRDGVKKGLWARKNGRELWFNGDVTEAQVQEANNRRKVECTLNLSHDDMLKVNSFPAAIQERFYASWGAAQRQRRFDIKQAVAELRKHHSAIDDSIRQTFGLVPKKRAAQNTPHSPAAPACTALVKWSVHSTTVHSSPMECALSEETGENVSVRSGASLFTYREKNRGVPASASSVLEAEADALVTALQIDADAATQLILNTRKVEPTITWREIASLSRKKLSQVKPRVSVCGLLLVTVPGMAKGAMLDAARAAVALEIDHLLVSEKAAWQPISNAELDANVTRNYPDLEPGEHTRLSAELREWWDAKRPRS